MKRDAMKRKNPTQLEIEIRRRVEAKYDERNALLIHFTSYAGVNILVWAMWLFSGGGFPWPLFVTVFWGIGMAGHLLDYYNKHGGGAQKREERIDEEVRRHLERLEAGRGDIFDDAVEKGADVYDLEDGRLRHARLADDGEIVEMEGRDERDAAEQRGSR